MEFGHIQEGIADIDFSLPPDTARTKRVLQSAKTDDDFQVFIGASKWGEKGWIGRIYPPKLVDKAFLPLYCKNFNTVELGSTFYTLPSAEQIAKWVNDVADQPGFKFSPKFPQQITHTRRLAHAEQHTADFYQTIAGFGNHLGPLLLQLGEGFSPKSFPQLNAYLRALPSSIKVHVEVRHKDWYAVESNRDQFFQLLQELKIGTAISDTTGRRDCVHMELTTDQVMIRFVGNDLAPSDYTRIDEWVDRLNEWKAMGLKEVWFFMHQNNEKYVPEACDYLVKRLNEKLGTKIAGPRLLAGNGNLFA